MEGISADNIVESVYICKTKALIFLLSGKERGTQGLFRCASISWIHVGESLSQWVMNFRFCQILGISSDYIQRMFRVFSGYVHSMFRACSEQVQSQLVAQLDYHLVAPRTEKYGMRCASSEQVQIRFRVGSEKVQSIFRACSDQFSRLVVKIVVIAAFSASSVSVFGIFKQKHSCEILSKYLISEQSEKVPELSTI